MIGPRIAQQVDAASGDRHPHDGRVEAGGHNADHVGGELKYGG
ncbi:alginate export family protein [Burkholderia cepacia]|nr:alginate export family protein [Burkholderia cepacia]